MLYPKIETLFTRDKYTFKVIPGNFRNEAFSLINEWEWTEKIDGTNIRITYSECPPPCEFDKNPRVSHKQFRKVIEYIGSYCGIKYDGRTDAAELPGGVVEYLDDKLCSQTMMEQFQDKKVIIYGEGYGGKIQKGGGYSQTQKFVVFDIFIDGFWLKREDIQNICNKLGLDVVPIIRTSASLKEAIDLVKVGFTSSLASSNGNFIQQAEGLIGRTKVPLFTYHGQRLITKLKTCDFQQNVESFYEKNNG